MIVAGIDAGLQAIKVVIFKDSRLLSHVTITCGSEPTVVVAERGLRQAAESGRISLGDIQYTVATGSGRAAVPFAQGQAGLSLCLAKGAEWISPSIRTVLDIGAQRTLAVKCQGGIPLKIATNDRCAAGSGMYLEMVAQVLGVKMERMAELAMQSKSAAEVASTCTVFAESEIISLIHMKKKGEDVLKGVLMALARRLYPLLTGIGWEQDLAIVGGVAKNAAMVEALRERLGCALVVPENPELVAALGAALIAQERV